MDDSDGSSDVEVLPSGVDFVEYDEAPEEHRASTLWVRADDPSP